MAMTAKKCRKPQPVRAQLRRRVEGAVSSPDAQSQYGHVHLIQIHSLLPTPQGVPRYNFCDSASPEGSERCKLLELEDKLRVELEDKLREI
jgi:hypothetical protein